MVWRFTIGCLFRNPSGISWKKNGKEDGLDGNVREIIARTGASIMGKRMFEEGEPNWLEDLFKSDVYVLTNEKRKPWIQKGTSTYYFINDRIENAFEKEKNLQMAKILE